MNEIYVTRFRGVFASSGSNPNKFGAHCKLSSLELKYISSLEVSCSFRVYLPNSQAFAVKDIFKILYLSRKWRDQETFLGAVANAFSCITIA